jgi:hypothetical protein
MTDIKSNEHLKRAGELFKLKEYDQSLEELDLVLKDEPNNLYALAAREKVRTERDLAKELKSTEHQKEIEAKRRAALEDSHRSEYQQRLARIEEEGRKRREEEQKKRLDDEEETPPE